MKAEGSPKTDLRPLVAVGLLALWAVAYNVLGFFTWHYGVLAFCMLMLMGGVVALAKILGRRMAGASLEPSRILMTGVSVFAIALTAFFVVNQLGYFATYRGTDFHHQDIAENTYRADNFVFDLGMNPYSNNAQVNGIVDAGPHISEKNGVVTMYGVPYYKGYPYFPAMFLVYEPFRRFESSRDDLRDGNLAIYFLLLIEIGWLAWLLSPDAYKRLAAALSIAAFSCSALLGQDLFYGCVTDFVIPLFALAGFIALWYRKHSLGGVFFGLAFACKLLPGGIFVLILALWYWRKPERWRFLVPMMVTFLLVLLPFVIPNPGAFLSATILFYLSFHAQGDDTALYYFLPSALQPIFQVVGYAAVAGLVLWVNSRKTLGLTGVLALCFISDILFTAFNRMAHLNYLWGVVPLGAVALAASALGAQIDSGSPRIESTSDH